MSFFYNMTYNLLHGYLHQTIQMIYIPLLGLIGLAQSYFN
jgi:hypothetical protein